MDVSINDEGSVVVNGVAYDGVILEPFGSNWIVSDSSYPEYKNIVDTVAEALEMARAICEMLDMQRMAPHEALEVIESENGDTVCL